MNRQEAILYQRISKTIYSMVNKFNSTQAQSCSIRMSLLENYYTFLLSNKTKRSHVKLIWRDFLFIYFFPARKTVMKKTIGVAAHSVVALNSIHHTRSICHQSLMSNKLKNLLLVFFFFHFFGFSFCYNNIYIRCIENRETCTKEGHIETKPEAFQIEINFSLSIRNIWLDVN